MRSAVIHKFWSFQMALPCKNRGSGHQNGDRLNRKLSHFMDWCLQYFQTLKLNWLIDFVIPNYLSLFGLAVQGNLLLNSKLSLSSHNQIRFLDFVENLEEFYSRGNVVLFNFIRSGPD